MSDPCFCHFNGFAVKDATARQQIEAEAAAREQAIAAEAAAREQAISAEAETRNREIAAEAAARNNAIAAEAAARNNAIAAEAAAREKVEKYVTPEMFGAAADGAADDTEAFRACWAAARERNAPIFISGNYVITSPMDAFDNMRIYGGGSVAAANGFILQNNSVHEVTIDGLTLTGYDATMIKICSFWSNFLNLTFKDCGTGIFLSAGNSSGSLVENRIDNCRFLNVVVGIESEGESKHTDGHITNCWIWATSAGITLRSASGWQLSNIHVYGPDGHGGHGIWMSPCFHTQLNNIYIEGGKVGLQVMVQYAFTMSNVSLISQTETGIRLERHGWFPYATYKPQLTNVCTTMPNEFIQEPQATGCYFAQ